MRRSLITTLAVLTLSTGGALSETARAESPREIRIAFNSDDLETPEGVSRLYERVVEAARSVCRDGASPLFGDDARCRAETIAYALEQANIAPLLELHRARRQVFASR